MAQETAIIIGAGPAGLTAAYELLDRTDKKPIVYEMTGDTKWESGKGVSP